MAFTEVRDDVALLERDELNSEFLDGFGTSFDAIEAGVDTDTRIDAELTDGFENDTVWELKAACRSLANASELFFSEEVAEIAAAKRICAACPVIAPCLEGALGRAEPCGVWGGQLFLNGRIVAQKRRRGRPPKVPRPEDQLPEVPIPAHLQKLIA